MMRLLWYRTIACSRGSPYSRARAWEPSWKIIESRYAWGSSIRVVYSQRDVAVEGSR